MEGVQGLRCSAVQLQWQLQLQCCVVCGVCWGSPAAASGRRACSYQPTGPQNLAAYAAEKWGRIGEDGRLRRRELSQWQRYPGRPL